MSHHWSPSQINNKMRDLMIEASRAWKWATYRADLKHRAQVAKLAKKRRK